MKIIEKFQTIAKRSFENRIEEVMKYVEKFVKKLIRT